MSREAIFSRALAGLRRLAPAAASVALWWVPGRIEVGGKHTDYAGGRSLVCATEQGIALAASPRADKQVRIFTTTLDATAEFVLGAPAPHHHHWALYPATVARRLRRDFGIQYGADLALAGDLPAAAGLSSSSALVIACYLALAGVNQLPPVLELDLACYLAAVESGRAWGPYPADGGVGTHGGSEDHTAILCARPGHLAQYSFCPARLEAEVAFPTDLIFAVACSGIVAAKTGNARAAYNAVADSAAAALAAWNRARGRSDSTLAAALAAAGLGEVLTAVGPGFAARVEQFDQESNHLVPALTHAFAAGDRAALGDIAVRSHALAARCLANQVPQTHALALSARQLGALAASPFGAGFGGAVWA
ncbi:MAG: galactokinase family protein, partial [Terriglobales bacterium]